MTDEDVHNQLPDPQGRTLLTGWGRTAPTSAQVTKDVDPGRIFLKPQRTPQAIDRGIIPRGLGRSYGDVAQNGGGVVVDMTRHARVIDINLRGGTVDVQAGISIDHLLRILLPLGLTLPVQPGTRQVTVGGAIACDIHGKNHHRVGSFGDIVEELSLLTPCGETRDLTPDGTYADLFWATIGGIGLTGIVTRARLKLRPVETSYVVVETERCDGLPELMETLRRRDETAEYSVAWFDSITTGARAGRGIVLTGRDALLDDLPEPQRRAPLHVPPQRTLRVPPMPRPLVNKLTGRAFNEVWFRRTPRRPHSSVDHSFNFFQPLDGLTDWYHLYGPRGLVQYQLVVPDAADEVVCNVVSTVAASGHVSCLNVLKRFGPGNLGMLSFPAPGWTLALDLPAHPGLGRLLDRLDAMVVPAGGRVYLAKDSRLRTSTFAAMYPQAARFVDICRQVDPDAVMQSDLARRLELTKIGER